MNKISLNGWQRLWVVFSCLLLLLIILFIGCALYDENTCDAEDYINQYYTITTKPGTYKLDISIVKDLSYKQATYEQMLNELFSEKDSYKKVVSDLIIGNKLSDDELNFLNNRKYRYDFDRSLSDVQEINSKLDILQNNYIICQKNVIEMRYSIVIYSFLIWLLTITFFYIIGYTIAWIRMGFKK